MAARLVFEDVAKRRGIDIRGDKIRAIQRANTARRHARNKRSRERRVQRSRAQHVQRTNIDVAGCDCQIVRQLALNADHRLQRVWRLQVVGEPINGSGNCKRNELFRRRNQREEIRILHRELLLIDAVQPIGRHRQVLTDALVEHAIATADDSLRLLSTRRPRKANARSKVQIAIDVALILVTQTKTQRKVWTHLPVVLHVTADVPLADSRLRITGRQTKLARPAAECANLKSAQPLPEENLRAPETFDTRDGLRACDLLIIRIELWTKTAAEERVGAAEVLRRELIDVNPTQASADFQRMAADRK